MQPNASLEMVYFLKFHLATLQNPVSYHYMLVWTVQFYKLICLNLLSFIFRETDGVHIISCLLQDIWQIIILKHSVDSLLLRLFATPALIKCWISFLPGCYV